MTATTFDYSQPMVESGNMTQTVESFNVHLNNIKPAFGNGMYLLKKGLLYIGRHFAGAKSSSYTIKVDDEGQSVAVSKINFDWLTWDSASAILGGLGVAAGLIIGNVGIAGAYTVGVAAYQLSAILGLTGLGMPQLVRIATPLFNKFILAFKSFWDWLMK